MQEERQRGKDRSEAEAEPASSANEDMPVEKILEAELAVEPKTETYVEATVGLNPSSVSAPPVWAPPGAAGPGLLGGPLVLGRAPGGRPRVGGWPMWGAVAPCGRPPPGLGPSFALPASLTHRPVGVRGL